MVIYRYAFRSTEKVALQEIGPRFTLKLRSLRKGIPAVQNFGEAPKPLEFDSGQDESEPKEPGANEPTEVTPPKQDEYLWNWKVSLYFQVLLHRPSDFLSFLQPDLEVTRKTFFL